MTLETLEKELEKGASNLWDIAQKVFTAVLAAALIGIYSQLQSATLELARAGERWNMIIQQIGDHELRLRQIETRVLTLSRSWGSTLQRDDSTYPRPDANHGGPNGAGLH